MRLPQSASHFTRQGYASASGTQKRSRSVTEGLPTFSRMGRTRHTAERRVSTPMYSLPRLRHASRITRHASRVTHAAVPVAVATNSQPSATNTIDSTKASLEAFSVLMYLEYNTHNEEPRILYSSPSTLIPTERPPRPGKTVPSILSKETVKLSP